MEHTFGLFEWAVRTGCLVNPRTTLLFPLIAALGGAPLLTHSLALGNVKEELLIELTHVPLALLGITAGWARWLERGTRAKRLLGRTTSTLWLS